MSDDLFKDCDCGDCGDCDCGDCGDCDCDCDCCDCDCSCDDCLPGNNFILICCCFSSNTQNTNDPNNRTNRTNNTSSSCFPCCCCCCCDDDGPRRRRHERKKKKKGFCCWRLWCCFARKEPSPPPSPRRPRPDDLSFRSYRRDGRYPMEDPDFYMNDRWARHHDLDMPPRGGGGGRYPIPKEMRMYRDENYGRGAKWNDPRESTRSSVARSREVNVVPPKHKPDEIVINPDEYETPSVDNDTAHQGHQFQGNWSKPMKYEEGSAKQTKK